MKIFDLEIPKLRYDELLNRITEFKKQIIVFTPNPEILLLQRKDKEFASMLKKADFLTSDGTGLYIAFQILDNNKSKIFNTLMFPYYVLNIFFNQKGLYEKYGDRICGSDITRDLLDFANKNHTGVIILDRYNPTDLAKVESQKIMPIRLKEKYPNIQFSIYIYKEDEKEIIIKSICKNPGEILLSAIGVKKQEEAVIEVMSRCKDIKVGLGIGSSIDYQIGFQKRAPIIWRKLGLEWLYRFITGPQKINRIKRIYNAIFVFTKEVVKSK